MSSSVLRRALAHDPPGRSEGLSLGDRVGLEKAPTDCLACPRGRSYRRCRASGRSVPAPPREAWLRAEWCRAGRGGQRSSSTQGHSIGCTDPANPMASPVPMASQQLTAIEPGPMCRNGTASRQFCNADRRRENADRLIDRGIGRGAAGGQSGVGRVRRRKTGVRPPGQASATSRTLGAAARRSSIFVASFPPASAKSGRPPPPPPMIGASSLTSRPA